MLSITTRPRIAIQRMVPERFLTTGNQNTADGNSALGANTTGLSNTAVGQAALFSNTTANFNTAVGFSALHDNTSGGTNTAIGEFSLSDNTTGSANTALGKSALTANTTGSNNVALGFGAGGSVTTANNVIIIGSNLNGANVPNSCFIKNIRGVTTAVNDAIAVMIDSHGQLGTTSSSRRFKKDVKPMDNASKAIHALKPVTFHYKSDDTNRPEFGLIAEQVAEVNPDLVVRDENGEIYTVRYDAVNAMLLNEFLKEHRKNEDQQKQIDVLTAQLKQQAALIRRVSDRIELNESRQKVAINRE
jgi:endosialidase-like protein